MPGPGHGPLQDTLERRALRSWTAEQVRPGPQCVQNGSGDVMGWLVGHAEYLGQIPRVGNRVTDQPLSQDRWPLLVGSSTHLERLAGVRGRREGGAQGSGCLPVWPFEATTVCERSALPPRQDGSHSRGCVQVAGQGGGAHCHLMEKVSDQVTDRPPPTRRTESEVALGDLGQVPGQVLGHRVQNGHIHRVSFLQGRLPAGSVDPSADPRLT